MAGSGEWADDRSLTAQSYGATAAGISNVETKDATPWLPGKIKTWPGKEFTHHDM